MLSNALNGSVLQLQKIPDHEERKRLEEKKRVKKLKEERRTLGMLSVIFEESRKVQKEQSERSVVSPAQEITIYFINPSLISVFHIITQRIEL